MNTRGRAARGRAFEGCWCGGQEQVSGEGAEAAWDCGLDLGALCFEACLERVKSRAAAAAT